MGPSEGYKGESVHASFPTQRLEVRQPSLGSWVCCCITPSLPSRSRGFLPVCVPLCMSESQFPPSLLGHQSCLIRAHPDDLILSFCFYFYCCLFYAAFTPGHLPFLLGYLFLLCNLFFWCENNLLFSSRILSVWQGQLTRGLIRP